MTFLTTITTSKIPGRVVFWFCNPTLDSFGELVNFCLVRSLFLSTHLNPLFFLIVSDKRTNWWMGLLPVY